MNETAIVTLENQLRVLKRKKQDAYKEAGRYQQTANHWTAKADQCDDEINSLELTLGVLRR